MVQQILHEMLMTVLVPLAVLLALGFEAPTARSETGKLKTAAGRPATHLIVAALALYSVVYVLRELGPPGALHRGAIAMLLSACGYELYRYARAQRGGGPEAA